MPVTSVQVKVLKTEKMKNETRWTIQMTNTTSKLAFFIRPQVMVDGEEVLPSFWSENYFTLAPSETTTLTVSCPLVKVNGKKSELKISGLECDRTGIIDFNTCTENNVTAVTI